MLCEHLSAVGRQTGVREMSQMRFRPEQTIAELLWAEVQVASLLGAARRAGDPKELISPRLLETGAALRLHDRPSGRLVEK